MVVTFMCEFFVITYYKHVMTCIGLFNQLLNLLERYYIYLHLCLLTLSSHEIV